MDSTFTVVDLTRDVRDAPTPLQAGGAGSIDLDSLRGELDQIRDALSPVLAEQGGRTLGLNRMELDLTVGLEGHIWFIAKGKGEASLRLTWSKEG